jgi:steroid 5-alpha reductase family enzyme
MRKSYGDKVAAGMFRLLQIQAVAAIPLGLAIVLAAHRPGPLDVIDLLGVAVFAAGIVGGGLADRQLRDFAADPANRGRICDVGLWRYSRHPNYFFECVLWASFAVIAFQPGAYPAGLVALLAPLTMTVLLTRISGIPPLEDHMVGKYGEAYRAYQARTSAFVPLPPRAGA